MFATREDCIEFKEYVAAQPDEAFRAKPGDVRWLRLQRLAHLRKGRQSGSGGAGNASADRTRNALLFSRRKVEEIRAARIAHKERRALAE